MEEHIKGYKEVQTVREEPQTAYKESEGKLFFELDWGFIKQMAEKEATKRLNSVKERADELINQRERLQTAKVVVEQTDKCMEEGIKETNGKVDYSEINLEILDLMAERFTANKHKYPKGNMKKSIDIKSLEWALFRHVKKMIQPIETDEESYKDHLSAVLCNASMILDQLNGK